MSTAARKTGEMMKLNLISAVSILSVVAGLTAWTTAANATVTFMNFVNTAEFGAVEGNAATIAFGYTGNGFVGESLQYSTANHRIYSTDLTGGDVKPFGEPIPGLSSGEGTIGVGLGQAGFAKGVVYVGNAGGNQIYKVPSVGPPVLFAAVPPTEQPRQIFFDPGRTFGGEMLVTTSRGNVYKFNSSGTRTLLANIGEDTEGLDIAGSAFGPYAGDLLTASEISGAIRAISPAGVVMRLRTGVSKFVSIPGAETLSVVPTSLSSSNPVDGFYVDNFFNVLKAPASEFLLLKGGAIVTSEAAGSPIWDLKYDSRTGFFDVAQVGTVPHHPEAAFFVTGLFVPVNTDPLAPVPEPSTWVMVLIGFAGLAFAVSAKRSSTALGP